MEKGLYLKQAGPNQYQWSNGITNPTFATVVNENQLFLIIGTDTQTGCSNVDSIRLGNSPKCCDIYIPNSFTPNGDGLNEGFSAKSECKFKEFKMYIFDKWGEEYFHLMTLPNRGMVIIKESSVNRIFMFI